MGFRLRCGVTAGAAYCPLVLGRAGGGPTPVGQRVAFVLVFTVSADRASLCTPVLGRGIVCPRTVGEAVTAVRGGADVGAALRAIVSNGVLGRAVLPVGSGGGVAGVFIAAPISVVTALCTPVLGAGIVAPVAVAIRTVGGAGADKFAAGVTPFLPIAPGCVGTAGGRAGTGCF